jgi:hypothetical protein
LGATLIVINSLAPAYAGAPASNVNGISGGDVLGISGGDVAGISGGEAT